MSEEIMQQPQAQPAVGDMERGIIQQVSMPLYQARGWMKLSGILMIINGVLVALSLVGLIIAWIPIWMGVVMYKAASAVEPAEEQGHRPSLIESMNNLKTYFTIMGVLNLIGLIFLVATICFSIFAIISGATWLDSFINSYY